MAKLNKKDYDIIMEAIDCFVLYLGNSNLEEDKKKVDEVVKAEDALFEIGHY